MKKYFFSLIILLFVLASQAHAQNEDYSKYMRQGKSFYGKSQYLTALERFDLAYEFAENDNEKDQARNWKNKSRKKIRQQQKDLKTALVKAEEQKQIALAEKQKADSLLILANHALDHAEQMQLKVETAMFDKAVKEHFKEWNGYTNTNNANRILEKIDSLDLSNNALLRLPKEVAECPNLKHINLFGNNNIDWQASAQTLSKLSPMVSVYVSVNDLSNIDSIYWHYVTGIKILQGKLTQIPKNILQQKQLNYLDLSTGWKKHNNFHILPSDFFDLLNLKYLNLIYCQIDSLQSEIGKLTSLTYLNLYGNKLKTLPPEIGKLNFLTYLNLGDNQLKTLPSQIENLTSLTDLGLYDNQLTSFPKKIVKLMNLNKLHLTGNKLTSTPLEIVNLTNLTSFSISVTKNSDISNIFNVLGKLPNLKELELDMKELKTLPSETGKLTNLTVLDLRFNQLTSLPPEIGKLTNLTSLDLTWNQLKTLPPEIFKLTKIKADNWSIMGQQLFDAENYETALKCCSKAIEKEPNSYLYYFNLSFYSLFINKPQETITAAQKSLTLAPDKTGVYTNLALGYVLNNEFEKAKPIYLEWKDKQYNENRLWKEVFLQDIADLETAGITHKDFKKVRKLLK